MPTTTKKPATTKAPKATKTVKEPTEKAAEKAVEPKGKYYYATGKRKTSIARVKLFIGNGEITVNENPISKYFSLKTLIGTAKSPLKLIGGNDKYTVVVKVEGGGISSQAEAIRHGIARALITLDPFNKPTLKKAGMLTRDSRVKERKKFGLKRARKAPQFSKR